MPTLTISHDSCVFFHLILFSLCFLFYAVFLAVFIRFSTCFVQFLVFVKPDVLAMSVAEESNSLYQKIQFLNGHLQGNIL